AASVGPGLVVESVGTPSAGGGDLEPAGTRERQREMEADLGSAGVGPAPAAHRRRGRQGRRAHIEGGLVDVGAGERVVLDLGRVDRAVGEVGRATRPGWSWWRSISTRACAREPSASGMKPS